MPSASTGYEVVSQGFSTSSPFTVSAATGTYIMWAFSAVNSTGRTDDESAVDRTPNFDGNGNIISVTFHDPNYPSQARTAYVVCVGK